MYAAGLSAEAIGDRLGVTETPVLAWLHKAGIAVRPGGFKNGRRYRCADGHMVRSINERRVDDWLSENSVPHVPEPIIPGSRQLRSDFLANGWYVEVWGIVRLADYTSRKDRKRRLYAEQNLSLLELEKSDFAIANGEPWRTKVAYVLQKPAQIPLQLMLPA